MTRLRGAAEFVDLLRLRGEEFCHQSLSRIVEEAYAFSAEVWREPQLYDFVDHGVEHSFQDLRLAEEVLAFLPRSRRLSALERAILGASSLFHDVGMQYGKYPCADRPLPKEDVRRLHAELGFEMIRDALASTFKTKRGGPELSQDATVRWCLDQAAWIGAAHSGEKYFSELAKPYHRERPEGNEALYRPRLLAAALRLGDELHCSYTRIVNFSRMDSPTIAAITKAHWAACYYVNALEVTPTGTGGIVIGIHWRVPRDADVEDQRVIRILLGDFREKRIREEAERVRAWLTTTTTGTSCLVRVEMDESPERTLMEPLPRSVRTYVESNLLPVLSGQRTEPAVRGLGGLPLADGGVEQLHAEANGFLHSGLGYATQHTALRTGWHTSKYLRCRDLLTNRAFVGRLCQVLARRYQELEVTDLLAIGTSGIRIGTKLAHLLGVRFHYTFNNLRVGTGAQAYGGYTDYEREVAFTQNARILVVDDIVGVGTVLEEVYKQVGEGANSGGIARCFCLYSVGDMKKALEGIADPQVEYLVSYPDVDYTKEGDDGFCEVCRGVPASLRRENERGW